MRIPKPAIVEETKTIPSFVSQKGISENEIVFSFHLLEKNKFFNLDMTCPNWANDLFERLKSISQYSIPTLLSGKVSTCRIHDHSNAKPPIELPPNIKLKDFYQIRISTAKGGIHGVIYENIFYVVWFDPLHNMYPDDRFGGVRQITPPSTCCKDRDSLIEKIINEKNALDNDINDLLNNMSEKDFIKKLYAQIEAKDEEIRFLKQNK